MGLMAKKKAKLEEGFAVPALEPQELTEHPQSSVPAPVQSSIPHSSCRHSRAEDLGLKAVLRAHVQCLQREQRDRSTPSPTPAACLGLGEPWGAIPTQSARSGTVFPLPPVVILGFSPSI